MDNIEIELRNALDDFRQKRIRDGVAIEDIVDEIDAITDSKVDEWFK